MGRGPSTNDIKRSYTMSRIKNKNTSIELTLRKALWHSGIRYRKNYSSIKGTPDIAITKYHIAIFCDGEFWHGKQWKEKKARLKNNSEYWINKIEKNIKRDSETERLLSGKGWKVLRFWGAEIKNDISGCVEEIKNVINQSKLEKCKDYYEYCI